MNVYLLAPDSHAFLNNISVLACREKPQTKEYAEAKEKRDWEVKKAFSLIIINYIALSILDQNSNTGAAIMLALVSTCLGMFSCAEYHNSCRLLSEKEKEIQKIVEKTSEIFSQKEVIQNLDQQEREGLAVNLLKIVDNDKFCYGDLRIQSAKFLLENKRTTKDYLASKGIVL